MRLRRALTWLMVGLGTVTLAACVALVVFTTLMRRNLEQLDRAQQSSKLASDLARNALAYASAASPTDRAISEARGRIMLGRLAASVGDEEERAAFDRVVPLLEGWWRSPDEAARRPTGDLALGLLRIEDLFALRAQVQRDGARALDTLSNTIGIAVAVLLGAGVALFLWMVRVLVFQPVESLAASVARFAGGDLKARASERGADEIRQIAAAHNKMADALARTREDQLRYVATVVHDLRNPLAAVQLAIGYATPGRPLPPEERLRDIFDLIGRQLRRLNSIVGDVLNAVQIETGEIVLHRRPCDIAELARSSVSLFQTMCPYHRLELETHGPTELFADAVRLEQVVNNLIDNAVKYTPPGTLVRVEVDGDDDGVSVTVRDEGPGVPADIEARIFRPFNRGASEHEEVPGVGLGLYVSRRVVEAHGGTLELLPSGQAGGAAFRFNIPSRAAPEQAEPHDRVAPMYGADAGAPA